MFVMSWRFVVLNVERERHLLINENIIDWMIIIVNENVVE
jgi:hypothetical protein